MGLSTLGILPNFPSLPFFLVHLNFPFSLPFKTCHAGSIGWLLWYNASIFQCVINLSCYIIWWSLHSHHPGRRYNKNSFEGAKTKCYPPTQFSTHGQWWSNLATHRSQTEQCFDLMGFSSCGRNLLSSLKKS